MKNWRIMTWCPWDKRTQSINTTDSDSCFHRIREWSLNTVFTLYFKQHLTFQSVFQVPVSKLFVSSRRDEEVVSRGHCSCRGSECSSQFGWFTGRVQETQYLWPLRTAALRCTHFPSIYTFPQSNKCLMFFLSPHHSI